MAHVGPQSHKGDKRNGDVYVLCRVNAELANLRLVPQYLVRGGIREEPSLTKMYSSISSFVAASSF